MDKNTTAITEIRVKRTVDALCKNNFDARYVKDTGELLDIVNELVPEGASCSVGGSMTLFETGVIDALKNGKFNYLDRYAENADTKKVFHDALSCDFYFMSSNAITEEGELYNMDGNGNRVAALIYGPERVVVIAGANKIVRNIKAARRRNRDISAPANCVRLAKDNPCTKTGTCGDCKNPGRICCHELISKFQGRKNRITVLILPESFGY